jgi:hypothetical protein
MASEQATAMLLGIGMQESKFHYRRQIRGPAQSLWMFERAGIRGVLEHPRSRPHIQQALAALRYDVSVDTCYAALADNDVLACIFARLLLWTLPYRLPDKGETDKAWLQYLESWRPGKPHEETWPANFAIGWEAVAP